MLERNFLVPIIDTDSLTVCKPDGSPFSEEEIKRLTKELNEISYEHINWDLEFYIPSVIAVKSKNYILHDPEKKYLKKGLVIKGASLKASNKEIYLKDFINSVINLLIQPEYHSSQVVELYEKTAKECLGVTDMTRFAFKKSYTEAVMKGMGTAELKARLALKYKQGVQQGDKFRMFYLPNKELCLDENFKGEYCRATLLKKLYATVKVFSTIIDINLFTNYSLQTNYYPFIGEEKPKRAKKVSKALTAD